MGIWKLAILKWSFLYFYPLKAIPIANERRLLVPVRNLHRKSNSMVDKAFLADNTIVPKIINTAPTTVLSVRVSFKNITGKIMAIASLSLSMGVT